MEHQNPGTSELLTLKGSRLFALYDNIAFDSGLHWTEGSCQTRRHNLGYASHFSQSKR
jgi:hypothetical protein